MSRPSRSEPRRRALTRPVSALAGVLALALAAGCGLVVEPSPPEPEAAPALSTDPTPVEAHGLVEGIEVDALVGPVAVDGDLAVLRLELSAPATDNGTEIPDSASLFSFRDFSLHLPAEGNARGISGVRLVDLDDGTVRTAARTSSAVAVTRVDDEAGLGIVTAGGEPLVGYAAYAAPTSASTSVFVPHLGLVEDVPVVAAEDAGDLTVPVTDLIDAEPQDLEAPVEFLETFTTQDEGRVSTRAAEETLTVSLDSDVMFATGSADLSPEADDALAAAAAVLDGADRGTLRVVGHTDDVGEEPDNQVLSEQRAQAVADRLGTVTDLDRFEVAVEGRGETEPLSAEVTDEARALNRRVEIELSGEAVREAAEAQVTATGEGPAAEGPVVTGLGGTLVEVTQYGKRLAVRMELAGVRRVGGYLLGDLVLTNEGAEELSDPRLLGSSVAPRGGAGTATGVGNVTLLDGELRTYPLDFAHDATIDGSVGRTPLGDATLGHLKPGESTTVTVVWPDTGSDTVVVDVPQGAAMGNAGSPPVRYVDVPVTG